MNKIERYCFECDKLTPHKARGFEKHNYRLECMECGNINYEENE